MRPASRLKAIIKLVFFAELLNFWTEKSSFLGGSGRKMPNFGVISLCSIIKSLIKALIYPIFNPNFLDLLNL
jgi:hypothetical protein